MAKNDRQPLLRVKTEDGLIFYPKFKKNTKYGWELNDKSFQDLIAPPQNSKQNVNEGEG